MAVISAKIISATTNTEGKATIVIEFNDGSRTWTKTYTQRNSFISADRFKEIVKRDLIRDLKINTQLEEITPLVGRTFNITI